MHKLLRSFSAFHGAATIGAVVSEYVWHIGLTAILIGSMTGSALWYTFLLWDDRKATIANGASTSESK